MGPQSLYLLFLGYFCLRSYVCCQDPDLTVLVCDWTPGRIFHLSLVNSTLKTVPISIISRPVAIDYDPQTRDIYWTDVNLKQIRATNLMGTDDRIILSLNQSAVPNGLAVDASNRKIFYSDAENDIIATVNMNGTNLEVIIDSGLDKPRAIVLHEEIRKLYLADWGARPFIAKANYDGTGISEIVTSGLGWPNGLALDKKNGIIYWCDAQTHNIESVKTDGTQRQLLLNEPTAHYFDIAFHQGALYFTDWNRRAILNLPADGGTVGHISSNTIVQLAGIHVISNINTSACPANQYGRDCTDCGKCLTNSVCEKVTGFCMAGCNPGYVGKDCKQECSAGTYGSKCESVCGNCAVGGCNHVDGRCTNGCIAGYKGSDCKTACPSNTYGSPCVPCGQCANGDACVQLSGYCPNGCYPGWTGNRCDTVSEDSENGNTDGSNGSSTSLVATVGAVAGGVAVLLIVVVIIIVILVVMLRRKKTSNRRPKPESDYSTLNTDRQSNIYSLASDIPPPYSTIEEFQLRSSNGGYAGLWETNVTVEKGGYATMGVPDSQTTTQESSGY